jgi:hypothetical protein
MTSFMGVHRLGQRGAPSKSGKPVVRLKKIEHFFGVLRQIVLIEFTFLENFAHPC